MKALDFFCGAGGLTRGLLDSGIDVVAGFDFDEKCQETYEYNNSDAVFINYDIRNIQVKDLKSVTKIRKFDNVLFAGCAPCQSFSQQRKQKKKRRDATLLKEFGRLVEDALPGHVLIENVPGLAKTMGFSTFQRFIKMLQNNGYSYSFDVVNAKHFGVPQNRRRLVLIASRNQIASLPKLEYGKHLKSFRTVRDAISEYPPIAPGESHSKIPNHEAASITTINLKRIRSTPHDGGDRRSWPPQLFLECHKKEYKGHTDVYGRMAWDAPAPTLTGKCNSISNGRYGHPEQDRAISLREAAALQSFSDNYIFFGCNLHIAQQIGNAVPVKLAEKLGKHLQTL